MARFVNEPEKHELFAGMDGVSSTLRLIVPSDSRSRVFHCCAPQAGEYGGPDDLTPSALGPPISKVIDAMKHKGV
jgi:hypothetical protein